MHHKFYLSFPMLTNMMKSKISLWLVSVMEGDLFSIQSAIAQHAKFYSVSSI